ncbi:MAG: hypothetical protein HYU69_16245 [Bacteroidetes bacterium]|nr:hypothetical protein [Bacteroidota bacterium]
MKKSTSDDLFQLIRSLGKAEKAYFKISVKNVSVDDKPFYIELFDFLEKQNSYNEDMLFKKFQPIKISRLSYHKNYLYNLILKTLHSFDESISARLRTDLNKIEFLFGKGLYKQCEKLIRKSKADAKKHGKYLALIELMEFGAELIHIQAYRDKTRGDIDNIFEEISNAMTKCKNYNDYRLLSSRLFIERIKKGFIRSREELKLYNVFLKHPLFQHETKAKSFQALNSYYAFYATYYFDCLDYSKAYHYSKKLALLLENNPHLLKEKPDRYLTALNNMITCQNRLYKLNEARDYNEKLNALKTEFPKLTNKIETDVFVHSLETHVDSGQFKAGIRAMEGAQRKLIQQKNVLYRNIEENVVVNYDFCRLYFGAEDYQKASSYLNKILNNPLDARSDLHCFSKIISLIIHFELNDTELLEYSIKSTYRYLLKRNRLYKFEDAILNFIRKKIFKKNTYKDLIEAFKELCEELLKLSKNPFEKRALEYFDFISWLESKIENRSFAEVVREKAKLVGG